MLRLSTFLSLSYNHRLVAKDDQYTYGFSFFRELSGLEVEKPYNNNLFNGVRSLTEETKTFLLATDEGKSKSLLFVENWLIPSIQPLTKNDYLESIASIINNDDTISEKTRKNLIKSYSDSNYEKFLYDSLMYSIVKDNINVKSTIDVDDAEFVFEANKICSLCGTSIEFKKAKKTAYKYGIINIFPEGLSSRLMSEFSSIKREPLDYDHRSNKICCCIACADDYEATPTTDKFIKLLNKKEFYKKRNDSNTLLEKAKLEDELNNVLTEIRWIKSFDELADFRKIPLELKEKIIDNEPLRFSIKTDVDIYYNYIRKQLSDLDDVGSEFRIIASQFQICYEKLSIVMSDQEEIYNRVITWVLDELKLDSKFYTAAKVVVSFFVQNCEVFK